MPRDAKGRFAPTETSTGAANDGPAAWRGPHEPPKAIPTSWPLIPSALFVLGLVLYAVTHG